MTVPNPTIRNGPYYPNGVTVSFPFTFRALEKDDVQVIRLAGNGTATVLSSALFDVTLTVNGGSAVFSIPPAVGDALYVQLNPSFSQEISLENEGAFLPEVITEGLDRSAQRSIWLRDRSNRSLLVPLGETAPSLPARALRLGGKVLGFNAASGDLEVQGSGSFKGDPGGNTMAIGLFAQAASLSIPAGTDIVQTSGAVVPGSGLARYTYRSDLNAAYVVANPLSAFRSANGRVFVLAEDTVTPQMFGARGDARFGAVVNAGTDDTNAIDAFHSYLLASRKQGLLTAIYRITRTVGVRAGDGSGFPTFPFVLVGANPFATGFYCDFDGEKGLSINDPMGSLGPAAFQGAIIGNFTINVAEGRRITQPFFSANCFSSDFTQIRVRADYLRFDGSEEMFRVGGAMQYNRFVNCNIEPYNVPGGATPKARGFSVGDGWRELAADSSAVGSNEFAGCYSQKMGVGFSSVGGIANVFSACKAVACNFGYIDSASVATNFDGCYEEGSLSGGYLLAEQAITVGDGTGSNTPTVKIIKSTYCTITGAGYTGIVILSSCSGARVVATVNGLNIEAGCQNSDAILSGQDGAVVNGEQYDCRVFRRNTARALDVQTMGIRPRAYRWGNTGSEFHVSEPNNPGWTAYKSMGGPGFYGVRYEAQGNGRTAVLVQTGGNIDGGAMSPIRYESASGHIFLTKVNLTVIPTYASDAAAGTGGLLTGDLYKTAAGAVMVKL